jgi:hypothetical protein
MKKRHLSPWLMSISLSRMTGSALPGDAHLVSGFVMAFVGGGFRYFVLLERPDRKRGEECVDLRLGPRWMPVST